MNTLLTRKYPVLEEEFREIVYDKSASYTQKFLNNIGGLATEIKNLCSTKRSICLLGKKLYLDTKLKNIMPNLENYEAEYISNFTKISFNNYFEEKFPCDNLQLELPTLSQLRERKGLLMEIYDESHYFACTCDDKRFTDYFDLEVAYNPYTDRPILKSNILVVIFPIVNLDYSYANELLVKYLIPYGFCPDELTEDAAYCFSDLSKLNQKVSDILNLKEDGKILFKGGNFLVEKLISECNSDWIQSLHWELVGVLKQYYEKKCIGESGMDTREELLNCEKIRADIEPYEERLLTDPNRGHWDLWVNQDDSQYTVEMAEEMVARNPICDINENGVIAIDFGTKSTIVVYQSDIEHSLPMGIGDGNLSKAPSAKRYENPTVMHFVNLDNFLESYVSKKGRPKTKWEDLTISHTAMDQFSNSKSEEYYEYLHQIKQWAGQREKQFRIQSHDGKTYALPAFLDLEDDGWNPIELYAYYIGLYINNMRKGHGIFLDYYLSFPVTYETKIREKIVRSFEKGLKKSLPESIINNKEVMKRFRVNGDISEPAAYAVCALQEYGFEPTGDEEIFYGTFDFGGGTTDFDFGLWKQSSKRRYDYTIENFGAGGDEYLGGENLLQMLAFEVFKANQSLMREKGYTFVLAPKCTEFLGSDSLLADSQEAEKNMHNLMEKLRPYWELKGSELDLSIIENEFDSDKVIAEIFKATVSHQESSVIEAELQAIMSNKKNGDQDDEEVLGDLKDVIERYGIEIEENNDQVEFVVTLFDKEGQDHPGEILYFSQERINQIIETRIREGVNSFFSALMLSYHNGKVKKPAIMNIFLAGNSCKSPVVRRVFEEAISEQERQIKEKEGIHNDNERLFEIFPPLGTEDAYKKMESRGIEPSRDDFEKPTGKTGVAFGLIQCRAGGSIERITNIGIDDEIPFQYFIGWRSKKKFVPFRDDTKLITYIGKPDYNTWYKFIEADDSVFDLYYTTLPECVSGELVVDGNAAVKRLRCDVDVVDEVASVYIRAIDPHTLEYVVARNDDEKIQLGDIIRKEL